MRLSPTMLATLQVIRMKGHGKAVRWPGGFWTYEGAKWNGNAPEWFVGTTTIQALVQRGELEYTKHQDSRRGGSFPIEASIPAALATASPRRPTQGAVA